MATDVILAVHMLLLLVTVQATIDSVIQEVKDQNKRVVLSHPSGKPANKPVLLSHPSGKPANTQDWEVYTVENSTDEYVQYQLDMIIKKDKLNSLLARKNHGRRIPRNAVEDSNVWPSDIPYMIDDKFNDSQKTIISQAINHVMRHTCVVFGHMKKGQQEPYYIKFNWTCAECNSFVGLTERSEHPINLADGCFSVEIVAHEILHALGLWHEHMRHDRDNYVAIHHKNITREMSSQFERLPMGKYRTFNIPYDYLSLMHYGKDSFGKEYNRTHRKITIEPKQPDYLDVIGNAPGLSFYDIKILNSMYKCAAKCEQKRCPDETQFLGKNCECYCQGPPHDAAVLCDPPQGCSLPTSNKYKFDGGALDPGEQVDEGSRIKVNCVNDPYYHYLLTGYYGTYLRCQDGKLLVYNRGSPINCPEVTKYRIRVTTTRLNRFFQDAGTDADVFLTLHGENGKVSNTIQLKWEMDRHRNLFEEGKTDVFEEYFYDIGQLRSIRIRLRSHYLGASFFGWHLYSIAIYDFTRKQYYRFWVNAWVKDRGGSIELLPNRDLIGRQCGDQFSDAEGMYASLMQDNTWARDEIGCNLKCAEIRYCHAAIYHSYRKCDLLLNYFNIHPRQLVALPQRQKNALVNLRKFCRS